MTDKLTTHIWKIHEIDQGFDRIVFRAYSCEGEARSCYICIQVEGKPILYSFRDWHGEPGYRIDTSSIKSIQRIEVPTGMSELERQVRQFILECPSFAQDNGESLQSCTD